MEGKNTNSQSILLYNTQNVDAELLIAGFSIRKKEYQRIWQDIQTGTMTHPETHYLIQGVRGSGKTTLLSRLAYEVNEDEDLKRWLIPILLNEEEYGILSLFTFWLRIAEKLAEYSTEKYSELYQRLSDLEADNSEIAWEMIQSLLDSNKQKIIVFVDNLGELFKDFDHIEQAQLREVLSLHSQIRLIGGSSQLLEAHFDGSAPFYQFFKLVNLKPISESEMHELLRSLAKQTDEEAFAKIEDIITNHPERIEAVRRLTDGVPRTIVLLFQIIMEGAKESSYAYLEETIDKTTPLYKHRMDDLSRQQKAIVHAIAMNWDAMSAKEIAEQTRLPSKTVSAQLVKLQKQWIVDKIETDTKNHLYIIKERFFNIWYLMRYGRESDRRRVLWLTRFLESWCNEEELIDRLSEIKNLINSSNKLVHQDYLNALLSSEKMPDTLKEDCYEDLIKRYPNIVNFKLQNYDDEEIPDIIMSLMDNDQTIKALDVANRQGQGQNICTTVYCGSLFRDLVDDIKNSNRMFKHAEELVRNNGYKKEDVYKLLDWYFYTALNDRKTIALEIISHLNQSSIDPELYIIIATIQLWNGLYTDSLNTFLQINLETIEVVYDLTEIEDYLTLLLSKSQIEVAYSIFKTLSLKEKFKPFYYATVSLLKDERRQEYLRMGSELQSTVDEILKKVEDYRVEYG